MPAWISHMFIWTLIIGFVTIINQEKIEAFLDKMFDKAKEKFECRSKQK